jgi:hypothetical protein
MLVAFALVAGGITVMVAGIAQWDRVVAARRWHVVEGEVLSALGLAAACLLARGAGAQSPSQRPATTPVGTWRGTSLCLVRPSACHDEIVVYRITHMKAVDSMTMDARKVVRGEEEEMGVLLCRFKSPDGLLTCALPRGTWQFRVRNDSLVGELRLTDNTKFRDVRTTRAP